MDLEATDMDFECQELWTENKYELLPTDLERPSTSSRYAGPAEVPAEPLPDIPALVSLPLPDALPQLGFTVAKYLPVWPPAAVLSGRSLRDLFIVRNIEDPLCKR